MLLSCLERKWCPYLSEMQTERFIDVIEMIYFCLDLLQNNKGRSTGNGWRYRKWIKIEYLVCVCVWGGERGNGHYIILSSVCMFENFHNKTSKNNIVIGPMSIPFWIIAVLKMKCTLLAIACMGIAVQEAYWKNQTLFMCFNVLICKMG